MTLRPSRSPRCCPSNRSGGDAAASLRLVLGDLVPGRSIVEKLRKLGNALGRTIEDRRELGPGSVVEPEDSSIGERVLGTGDGGHGDEVGYSGVRVHLDCRLSSARTYLKVDVNVGDPIAPAPEEIHIPRLLDGTKSIDLIGYPLSMVHAEKIVTALQRGTANTRWRDFADIYLLARWHSVDGEQLVTAIGTVARHRGVVLSPLADTLAGYADVAGVQLKWASWRRRLELDDRLPESFAEVLADVQVFADSALTADANGDQWRPQDLAWRAVGER